MKETWLLGCLGFLLVQGGLASRAWAKEDGTARGFVKGADETASSGPREGAGPGGAERSSSPLPAKGLPEPLPGQLSSLFRIDAKDPESSVPTTKERDGNPLEYGYFIQDVLVRAEDARRAHDYPGVVKYYRAVAKAVPENAQGWSKLCEAYEILNDRERAIRACKYAIERPGVELQDYTRYVHLILGKDGKLAQEDSAAVTSVLAHLDKQPALQMSTSLLRCELGVKQSDVPTLETCVGVLKKLAPEDPKTIVFEWNLALQKGQRAEAELLLARARKAGVVTDNLARMELVTKRRGGLSTGLIGAAALLVVAALAWAIRRRRLLL